MIIPKLRAPVVLVHGLLGYDRLGVGPWGWDYFRGIKRAIEAAGNRVLVPRLSPTAGIAERARQLQRFIHERAPSDAAHIIAHSMGGLDARYLISRLGFAPRALSLTTIGTPHRGSPFADWALRRLEPMLKPFFQVLNIPHQAFVDVSARSCVEFNRCTPDAPGVRYFAVAGRCEGPWLTLPWRLPHMIVARAEGPNDGVVSVASATWGETTDIWDSDHLNLINVPNLPAQRRGLWTDRTELYAGLIRRLADLGF